MMEDEETALLTKKNESNDSGVQRYTVTSAEIQGLEKAKLLDPGETQDDNVEENSRPVFEEKEHHEVEETPCPVFEEKDVDRDVPNEIPPTSENTNKTEEEVPNRKRSKEGKSVNLQLDIKAAHKYGEKKFSQQPHAAIKHLQTPGTADPSKPLKVQVFLKEGEGTLLTLEKGKFTSAGEIKNMMVEVLSIPKSAKRLFAIWLISPYLELQLKSHHIPYILRKEWREMLISYSSCQDEGLAATDEPVLVFQRNSFCSLTHEEDETHENVVKRLFVEARDNILNARYPIPVDDAIMLGGILARIELGPFTPDFKPGYSRKHFSKLLPFYAIGSNRIIQQVKSSSVEQLLREQHDHVTKKTKDVLSCQRQFLDYCRSLPFYGCAFFKGKVLADHSGWKVWKSCEKEVSVGINRNGITIFKGFKQENIIYLPYDDLSWEYLREEGQTDAFCIEYDLLNPDGEVEPQQIQIITRQACMMDAMVDSCVNSLNVLNVPITPTAADYSKLMELSMSKSLWEIVKTKMTKAT